MNDMEYYRGRERAEREAASSALCPEARRAHEELARAYGELIAASRTRLTLRF